jgi:uncharacterized radical SAM protein YgiQ
LTFPFLPTNLTEAQQKGWDTLDIILVSGDAYIDHPSFGPALVGRFLESFGYKVGIIPQPDWKNPTSFQVLGKPNLFFGVTAGNLDSMVSNYTSEKRPRKTDMYSEDNRTGQRPDRATLVYTNCLKQCFPDTPIILGGLEASLRRLVHYDYWSNKLRRSILFDSRADLLVYGMGEVALLSLAQNLKNQLPLVNIPNTAYISDYLPNCDYLLLSSYEELLEDKILYAKNALLYAKEISKKSPRVITQPCQNKYVIIEPLKPISPQMLDSVYHLPFMRKAHPRYKKNIPAFGFVKNSVVSHRGCFGGCSFCSLSAHQGRQIISRSKESILTEINNFISADPQFDGVILDVGGPSANMYQSTCSIKTECSRLSCLYPNVCQNLKHNQAKHLELLTAICKLPKIKKVFVNSGLRFDLALCDKNYIEQICKNHVCGQLSIAPEHISGPVLNLMQKPSFSIYEKFVEEFNKANYKYDKKQYLIPYFIAGHPGSTLDNMFELALYLKKHHLKIEQVQNYIPLPLTLSEAMYYSEHDVWNLKKIHVAKGEERLMQRALLQPYLITNHNYLKKALQKIGKSNMFAYLSK